MLDLNLFLTTYWKNANQAILKNNWPIICINVEVMKEEEKVRCYIRLTWGKF